MKKLIIINIIMLITGFSFSEDIKIDSESEYKKEDFFLGTWNAVEEFFLSTGKYQNITDSVALTSHSDEMNGAKLRFKENNFCEATFRNGTEKNCLWKIFPEEKAKKYHNLRGSEGWETPGFPLRLTYATGGYSLYDVLILDENRISLSSFEAGPIHMTIYKRNIE